MFLHQTNVLVYPSSITYDETVTLVGYCGKIRSFKECSVSLSHYSQETARLGEDSECSSVVDERISPTPASQVLSLTWQHDMWLDVAYGV